jgi:hypothetical protein
VTTQYPDAQEVGDYFFVSLNGLDSADSADLLAKLTDQLLVTGLDQAGLDASTRWQKSLAAVLEHVRVGQNQHLQFGTNGDCAGDAVTVVAIPTPACRSAAAVVKLPNVKLLSSRREQRRILLRPGVLHVQYGFFQGGNRSFRRMSSRRHKR